MATLASRLRRDERGAIAVVGAVMAFVLAAAIFYVIGTGNAIIYRERLQDTSDAIAYSAGGVHARGMNLIVLVNLIDAALLAILASLRLLTTMVQITLGACASLVGTVAAAVAPFCGPFVGWATPVESKLGTATQNYAQVVDKVLPVLSKTQTVVARTSPHVALAKAVAVADENGSGPGLSLVKSGVMVSPSLVPAGRRQGLPIEDMGAQEACLRSAELGADMALFWTPTFAEKAMTWAAGGVAEQFPGFYCGQGSATGMKQQLAKDLKKLASALCKQKKKAHDKAHAKNLTPPPFDLKQCREDELEQLKQQQQSSSQPAGAPELGAGRVPKTLYAPATIGGDWFQVWGVAFGDEKWPRHLDRGIALAAAGGLVVPTAGFGDYRFAQAEFFWDAGGEWTDNRALALWQMRWQTRLRRVRLQGVDVREAFDSHGLDALEKQLAMRTGSAYRPQIRSFLDAMMRGFTFPKAEQWLSSELAKAGATVRPGVVH